MCQTVSPEHRSGIIRTATRCSGGYRKWLIGVLIVGEDGQDDAWIGVAGSLWPVQGSASSVWREIRPNLSWREGLDRGETTTALMTTLAATGKDQQKVRNAARPACPTHLNSPTLPVTVATHQFVICVTHTSACCRPKPWRDCCGLILKMHDMCRVGQLSVNSSLSLFHAAHNLSFGLALHCS